MAASRKEYLEDLAPHKWCCAIIESPEWRPLSERKDSTNELLGDVLWSPRTYRTWRSFYRAPHQDNSNPSGGEYRLLLSLGAALSGWKGMCHGGMLLTICDEAMQELAATELHSPTLTREMVTKFDEPLPVPGVVMVRAWPGEAPTPASRKLWVHCQVEDGGSNTIFVKARALFIKIRKEPKL
ncbi:MAG: hypothetical protein Q9210_007296 [Variospora velana]